MEQGAAVVACSDDALAAVQARIVGCVRCPRLVAWRADVATRSGPAVDGPAYWARPVPGFGDAEATVYVLVRVVVCLGAFALDVALRWAAVRPKPLFLTACGLKLANPAPALAEVRPLGMDPAPAVLALSGVLFLSGLVLAVLAQNTMGCDWRTGIDPGSTAPLVVHGPFRLVRNPTYTSLLANGVAIALLVPTALAVGAALVGLLALQIQTRLVEEPHLERLHNRAYHDYAARVGRFLPLVGRCRRTS